MQPRHYRSLFLLISLNLLIKPFWLLGIDRNVQLTVGVADYGLYYSLFNLSFLFQIILDPGIHTFINKNVAQNGALAGKYFTSFMPLKIGLAVLYLVISLVGAFVLHYDSIAFYLLGWMALNQVLSSLILYSRAYLAGLHLFNTDSIFSVLDRLLMIIICSLLLWGGIFPHQFKIEYFVYAQAISYATVALIAFFVVINKTKFMKPELNFSFILEVIKKSYPYALLTILMTMYTRIDAIMIERMLPANTGATQAGVYASAYRLLDAVNMIAFLFATILLPVFSGMIQRGEDVGKTATNSFTLLIVPAFIICLCSYFYRGEIMVLLYGDAAKESAMMFGCLMFTFLALCTIYIFGTLLTANSNIRFLNISSAVGLVGNVILNIILIPKYQAMGAVVATLVTQLAVSGSQMLKAHQLFSIKIKMNSLLRSGVFILVAVSSFLLKSYLSFPWHISLLFLLGLNITFAFVFGLFNLKFFLRLIKTKTE
ncbi:MAG: oligosaccharide flippase family protein [Bacteroidetes bacterium]|nr:oligosaccharide flippase family protein [Bacteroidota bacterium]